MSGLGGSDASGGGVRRFVVTSMILITWYMTTSACNIGSKLFITASVPEQWMDCALTIFNLSMIQLVWGVLLGAIATGRLASPLDLLRIDKMIAELPEGIIWLSPTKNTKVFSSVCHAIGGFSLNLCYLYSSVFIVQVLKSAEPVATLSLGVVILGEKPSIQLVLSVLTIIMGVAAVCFRDSTVSLAPIMIAMLSNFVLPMRNVLSKKIMLANADSGPKEGTVPPDQKALMGHDSNHDIEGSPNAPPPLVAIKKPASKDGNPAESFYMMSLIAAYFLFPFWALTCVIDYNFMGRIYGMESLSYVMLSGFMHASYNLSSFGFLSRVSTPTTHAIANVFKRVFTIWSAIVFFGQTDSILKPLTIGGLAVSTLGLFWYGSITANAKKG